MALARAVKDVFIVAAKRTPFGTYGGKLMNFTATDLQEVATRAALEAGKIKPEWVNSIIVGNVFHATADGAYLPRHMGIRVGIPVPVPALAVNRLCGSGFQSIVSACQATKDGPGVPRYVAIRLGFPLITPAYMVNRMCGSGFQSIVSAAQEISCGDSELIVTGGAENMSLAPHAVRNIRFGVKLGFDPVLEDTLWQGLIDQQIKTPMGITAENLAEKYNITREECDAFALRSQATWKNAQDSGYFKEEMAPVTIKSKKGEVVVDMDEHPRPQTTPEQMAKLPPVFKKGGTVNAANASGICDGAGCVIVASEAAVKKYDLTPLVRLAGYGFAGCDPSIMGIGPVPAIHGLLGKTGIKLSDVDIIEVNEAFAAQTLAVQKELSIDMDKLNRNGGAIALGHPVGASGSRITAHLTHEMRRTGVKYAIGSACIGGGQGIALLLEKV